MLRASVANGSPVRTRIWQQFRPDPNEHGQTRRPRRYRDGTWQHTQPDRDNLTPAEWTAVRRCVYRAVHDRPMLLTTSDMDRLISGYPKIRHSEEAADEQERTMQWSQNDAQTRPGAPAEDYGQGELLTPSRIGTLLMILLGLAAVAQQVSQVLR